jgi:hypothetical protein
LVSSEEIADPFAVSLERKPMHLKKLTNAGLLKRGDLLIALKFWERHHYDANVDSLLDSGTGVFPLHRYRQEPVPWVSHRKNRRFFRHPRTTNERRANCATTIIKEIIENHGVTFKVRPTRSLHRLPTTYDDIFLQHQRNWKKYRRTQCKDVDCISRRIHSSPFWVV